MAEFLGDGGILDDPMVYFENVAPPTWEASEISASGASPGVSSLPGIDEELGAWGEGWYHNIFTRRAIIKAVMDGKTQYDHTAVMLAKEGLDAGSGVLRLGKELGRGSFGTVVEAHCATSGQKFAAKFALGGGGQKSQLVEMAVRCRLGSHDNIVDCHAMDDRTAQAVILLDFCDGGDMHPIASSANPTSDLDKIRLMRGVAAGLSHMHQSGVVHVDMKPENVFLKRDGEGTLSPKIGDFGLSLAVGQLRRGQGTIGYTPPEVMLGDLLPCAPNQDVYALGHMMLVLFAKRAYKSANMFTSNLVLTEADMVAHNNLERDDDRQSFIAQLTHRNMTDQGSLDKLLDKSIFPEALANLPEFIEGLRLLVSPDPLHRPLMSDVEAWLEALGRHLAAAAVSASTPQPLLRVPPGFKASDRRASNIAPLLRFSPVMAPSSSGLGGGGSPALPLLALEAAGSGDAAEVRAPGGSPALGQSDLDGRIDFRPSPLPAPLPPLKEEVGAGSKPRPAWPEPPPTHSQQQVDDFAGEGYSTHTHRTENTEGTIHNTARGVIQDFDPFLGRGRGGVDYGVVPLEMRWWEPEMLPETPTPPALNAQAECGRFDDRNTDLSRGNRPSPRRRENKKKRKKKSARGNRGRAGRGGASTLAGYHGRPQTGDEMATGERDKSGPGYGMGGTTATPQAMFVYGGPAAYRPVGPGSFRYTYWHTVGVGVV